MSSLDLPQLPVPHKDLARYIVEHPGTPMIEMLQPYREYEAKLRQLYAQDPENGILKDPYLNVLPLFACDNPEITIRARDRTVESQQDKDRFIMSLPDEQRRTHGSPAVVQSLKEFQHNFNVFSESSLVDLDWSNVVASGSSVVNCLLPVPNEYNASKRTLREFYHEKFAPASDVDLFLYGLTEEQAIEKIQQIEAAVRDAILTETTTVRTKHAITICSQYPTRHVQIVLRIYKNISEILTGFDIDCSGAAYNGKQVLLTPRALQSYITQINHIDLSRRSPSYENRLSKYSHRGFEVYWPDLNRSRIDPTIFERSFMRTLGLARLLVLERLPTSSARDQYLAKRREERGRPPLNRQHFRRLAGNIKDYHEDEVAEWVEEEEASNYHTFTVPYGIKFHAKKIEKLCYTRDLLLNAEWNQPKHREVYLHRHPAFFGRWEDVMNDCCSFCPVPQTQTEKEVYEQENKIYVSGKVSFIKDDPGRQQIGSFNPLTDDDWTEMAYVGNTARLCLDIVDGELEHVQDWLAQDGADPNTRDYTGRTPLHLAVSSSTPEIVKSLVDHGARLVARLADGRTALHLAAERGNVEIVKILMDKSAANEAEEEEKQAQKRRNELSQSAAASGQLCAADAEDSDVDMLDDAESDEADEKSTATGSFVKVRNEDDSSTHDDTVPEENEDDPDFYDINVVAWDTPVSALHLAIFCGHEEVVKLLCQEYGADLLLPVKLLGPDHKPMAALLSLVLSVRLPLEKAKSMAKTLLSLGATCAQADLHGVTAFQRLVEANAMELVKLLIELDQVGVKNSINHVAFPSWHTVVWPLQRAVDCGDMRLALQLLDAGATSQLDFETWLKAAKQSCMEPRLRGGLENNTKLFETSIEQPIVLALKSTTPSMALELIKHGVDVNAMTTRSRQILQQGWHGQKGETVLDLVRGQIKRLREWSCPMVTRPQLKYGMDEVLSKFEDGTWQHAAAMTAVSRAKGNNKAKVETYEKEKARIAGLQGIQMKQAAVDSAVATFEQIEKDLIAKGGKTFEELHPDYKHHENRRHNHRHRPQESPEFNVDFSFYGVSDVTEKRKAKYIELFEAAWTGDLEKIKTLTLTSWDPENNEPPLQIAVNCLDSNPLAIAYCRGHRDVVRAILQIAQIQYSPEEKVVARYRMQASEDADDSEGDGSDDDEPKIYEEIVDEQFTVENIGLVSMQVKSRVTPLQMLNYEFSLFKFRNGQVEESSYPRACLLRHIINSNDRKGLKYYHDLVVQFAGQNKDEDDEDNHFAEFPQWAFWLVLQRNQIEMLADMIQWAGAGLPLEQLVKTTGTELREKPKHYQGLTVYGKKRKDWAAKGRGIITRVTDSGIPPLLYAAQDGSIESVEWFLSGAPLRHYLEFGKSKAAEKDVRLKHLKESPGGFDRAVSRWLGSQNDLVIHAAILGPNDTRAERVVAYLIKAYPSSLEAKNVDGLTPLAVASVLGRLNLVEILVANGADQSVKDKQWNNILHLALSTNPKTSQLRAFMDLLDPNLRSHLLQERSSPQTSDGRTPLHRWVGTPTGRLDKPHQQYVEELRLLLEFSKGEELDCLDASGDTPLHTLIRDKKHPSIIDEVLRFKPQLLYRENAVGQTPAELIHQIYVRECVQAHRDARYQSWRGDTSVAQNLLNKRPEDFAKEVEDKALGLESDTGMVTTNARATLPRVRQIYELVNKFAEGHPGKRRLVSLHEANDVAQRIGETYQGQRYGWKGFEDKKTRRFRRSRKLKYGDLPDEEEGNQAAQSDVVSTKLPGLRMTAWQAPTKIQ